MRALTVVLASLAGCAKPVHPVPAPHASLLLVNCGGVTDVIAIGGDHIVAVGEDAKGLMAERRIDVGGRLVIPGIHDAHVHEPVLFDAEVVEGTTQDSVEQTLAAIAAVARETPRGRWLHATLGDASLDGGDSIDQARLDRAAPNNPVWLDNDTGHVVVLNGSAESLLAIPANRTRPGWHFEYERYKAMRRRAIDATDADIDAAIGAFEAEAITFGITSVTAFPLDVGVERLARQLRSSPRKVRWHVVRTPLDGVIMPPPPTSDPFVTVEGTKYFVDGMHVERGAALKAPYADVATTGRLDFEDADIEHMLSNALETNDTLHLHVVGDRAIDQVFAAVERVPGAPVVLEHAHMLRDFERASRLLVSIVATPSHADNRVVVRLGHNRARWWMPLGEIIASGIPLAIGSDGDLNPFANVARTMKLQSPLSREQALAAYTDGRPFVAGMTADLAVLTGDVDDPDTRSVLTIVDGEIVYEADTFSRASAPTSARTE